MNPLIGITTSYDDTGERAQLSLRYAQAIERAGGVPVLIATAEHAEQAAARLDALVLSGGGDVDPRHFGAAPSPYLGDIDARRDEMELALIDAFVRAGKPMLGICRGIQILNAALGGDLIQDVYHEGPAVFDHTQEHPVVVLPGTALAEVFGGAGTYTVNSSHHQAVGRVAPGFTVAAESGDHLIEAIVCPERKIWGVQWHPERMREELVSAPALFAAFVRMVAG